MTSGKEFLKKLCKKIHKMMAGIENIGKWVEHREPLIMATATVFMAIATIFMANANSQSVAIYKKLADISQSTLNMEEEMAKNNELALETELRPYLGLTLGVGSDLKIKKIDEAVSIFYMAHDPDKNYIILPFFYKNVGKTPALDIEARYSSSWIDSTGNYILIQPEEIITSSDKSNHLLSGESDGHSVRISIIGIENRSKSDKLQIKFKVDYGGFYLRPATIYTAELTLLFKQEERTGGESFFILRSKEIKYGKKEE